MTRAKEHLTCEYLSVMIATFLPSLINARALYSMITTWNVLINGVMVGHWLNKNRTLHGKGTKGSIGLWLAAWGDVEASGDAYYACAIIVKGQTCREQLAFCDEWAYATSTRITANQSLHGSQTLFHHWTNSCVHHQRLLRPNRKGGRGKLILGISTKNFGDVTIQMHALWCLWVVCGKCCL